MKFYCRVVGHQRVQTKRLPDRCKVTMKGTEVAGLKVEFLIGEDEMSQFPYGATFELSGTKQQRMDLEPAPKAEKSRRKMEPEPSPQVEDASPALAH